MKARLLKAVFAAMLLVLYAVPSGAAGRSGQSVVVLHSYEDKGQEGKYFRKVMKREFRRHHLHPEIHHIYMGFPYTNKGRYEVGSWDAVRDSIAAFHPDVILLNDDFCMDWLFFSGRNRDIIRNTPSVFAGVNILQSDSLAAYPLMTGFMDEIDLPTNAGVYLDLTDAHNVVIEIEHSYTDSLLYRELRSQIADTSKFVDDFDFHMKALNEKYFAANFPGKMIFSFLSVYDPYANKAPGDDDKKAIARTHSFFRHANHNHQLQVKYDLFSSAIIDRSRLPQPSCIREQFGSVDPIRVLGGYFADLETQISDEVEYASHILTGVEPAHLPVEVHAKDFHLDYRAMQVAGIEDRYTSLRDQYDVINVPYRVAYPVRWGMFMALLYLLAALLVNIISYIVLHRRLARRMALAMDLSRERNIRRLSLSENDACTWRLQDGYLTMSSDFAERHGYDSVIPVSEFAKHVDEGSRTSFEYLLSSTRQSGEVKRGRIALKDNASGQLHWWEISFKTDSKSVKASDLIGMAINVDEAKAAEDEITAALDKANEVQLKENFIANISHDIRTPLGAVTGFAQLLVADDVTDEERQQYAEIIASNTGDMLSMIDDVVSRDEAETGSMTFKVRSVSAREIVEKTYNTNKILVPHHLSLSIDLPLEDAMVDADPVRTGQVLNNFLSNAFKFTPSGGIVIGYKIVGHDPQQVEFYVTDTGIGIAVDRISSIFGRFSKVNENDRGTGLGLSICKSIIECQGGRIGVESMEGKGSTFYFVLNTSKPQEA